MNIGTSLGVQAAVDLGSIPGQEAIDKIPQVERYGKKKKGVNIDVFLR